MLFLFHLVDFFCIIKSYLTFLQYLGLTQIYRSKMISYDTVAPHKFAGMSKLSRDTVPLGSCCTVRFEKPDTLADEQWLHGPADELRPERPPLPLQGHQEGQAGKQNPQGTVNSHTSPLHCKKRLTIFPSPVGMPLTKLSLALFPVWRVWLVTSRLKTGKLLTIFYSVCTVIPSTRTVRHRGTFALL